LILILEIPTQTEQTLEHTDYTAHCGCECIKKVCVVILGM